MGQYLLNLKAKGTTAEMDAQLEEAAAQAALQLESDLLATRKALRSAEVALSAAKSAQPLSGPAICEAMDNVDAYKKGLSQLEALKTELF